MHKGLAMVRVLGLFLTIFFCFAPTLAHAQNADVSVIKTGPATVTAGSNATYDITVTNNGPDDAQAGNVSDTVPANTTFVSLTSAAGFSCTTPAVGGTGTVSCTAAILTAGTSATFQVVFYVNASTPNGSVISNTATVSTTTPDPNNSDNFGTAMTTVYNVVSTPVPTISEWGMIILILLVGIISVYCLRRRIATRG